MIKLKNTILVNQDFICGIFYYAIEYLDYLLKNNLDFYLILNNYFRSFYKVLISDKYDLKKLHPDLFNKIIFLSNEIYYIENLLIFDSTTIKHINKFIFKNLFYNYGNDLSSREKSFAKKNLNKVKIITFGDKELNLKVDFHYPLCLNFKIFRDKKELEPFDNKIFSERNKENLTKNFQTRYKKDFHKSFNTLDFTGNDNVWDRANRIIPECKFYGKKIIYDKKPFLDSTVLRYERDWKDYDIWTFKSFDTNLTFAEWLKGYL